MPKVILPTTPPSTYFFSAFPPGSAGFRRVPPGSSAGFCRVPAGFRWVPPLRWVLRGSAGFQAFSGQFGRVLPGLRHKVPAPDSPFKLLLRLCQVLARRLRRLRQSKKHFLQFPHIAQVSLWKK